jgi:hypothetical protein
VTISGLVVLSFVLFERRVQALEELLFGVRRLSWIHRSRFGVLHPVRTKNTGQVRSVVGDTIAVPQECIDLLWGPRLALFEKPEELFALSGREFRGRAARECRPQAVNGTVVPRSEPPVTGLAGDTDASGGHLGGIVKVDVLDETQPSDEAGLVRLLGFVDRRVELLFRQMLHHLDPTTCLHQHLYAV